MTAALIPTTDRPYQLLPPLDAEQRHILKQSIERCGVLEPVVFDEDGEILDGHHRVEIAEELGIEYPRRVIDDLDRPGKHMYALTVNVARRQLDQAGRSSLVAQMRIRGMSIRRIAQALGVSHGTVSNDLAQLSNSGQLKQPERITGADGKDRPATRPAQTPGPGDTAVPPPGDPGTPSECLGVDMDCGRPLPCPDHPRTPAERIAAVAEVAPEFVKPVEQAPAVTPPPGSPATWTPEQHEANRLEIQRKQSIEAAERFAKALVLEVRGMVTTIIDGIDCGAPGILVSLADIDECRSALDRLEARVMA